MSDKVVVVDDKEFSEEDVRKFATRIRIDGESGCWVWVGALGGFRTGTVSTRTPSGKLIHVDAKRFAWATVNGPLARGLQVEPTCGNPLCVNPDHLRLVTLSTAEYQQVLGKLGVKATA